MGTAVTVIQAKPAKPPFAELVMDCSDEARVQQFLNECQKRTGPDSAYGYMVELKEEKSTCSR